MTMQPTTTLHLKAEAQPPHARSGPFPARARPAFALLAAVTAVFIPATQADEGTDSFPGREFWSDPAFVDGFMGTYGFATDIEPSITRSEQELLGGIVELMEDDPQAAAEKLEGGLTEGSSAALDFVLGNLHFQLDQPDRAAGHYERALEKFPNFMRAHKNLGMIRVRLREFDRAARGFTRAIELGGGDGNTYGLLGLSRLNEERYHSAESAYRMALLHDPANSQWRLGTAQVLLAQDRYREANSLLEELIREHPERADYYLYQANAYIGMEQPHRAAANYELVRRLGAATPESLVNLGDLYLEETITDLALERYLEALDRDPPLPIRRALRTARILTERHAWDEAAALVERIEGRNDDASKGEAGHDLTRLRARILFATGDEEEAVRKLERVVEKDPFDGLSLILLARHYGEKGENERAELLFERAARVPGHEAEAYLRHAELLVREKRLERAAELLRRSQQLRPRDSVARYLERVESALRAAR